MSMLQTVLAALIKNGSVTVETPNLDMDRLRQAVQCRTGDILEDIQRIVYEEEMTDEEKVVWIQKRLDTY